MTELKPLPSNAMFDWNIDVFRGYVTPGGMAIDCKTCGNEAYKWPPDLPYGRVIFTPNHHDPHCPARNHVYLEGIGPMIEPRAMVFEKENSNGTYTFEYSEG